MGILFTILEKETESIILDSAKGCLVHYFSTVFEDEPNDVVTVLSRLNGFFEHRAYSYAYQDLGLFFSKEMDGFIDESYFIGKQGAIFLIDPTFSFAYSEKYKKIYFFKQIDPFGGWYVFITYKEVGIGLELGMNHYFESKKCRFKPEEKLIIEEIVAKVKIKLATDDSCIY